MLRPFAHPVACCWMLLRVVAQSLKPVKLFVPCKRAQHCWLTTPNIVGSCCAHCCCSFIKHHLTTRFSKRLWGRNAWRTSKNVCVGGYIWTSLLAEVSHDEAQMRERRESLSFLSFLPRRPLLAGKIWKGLQMLKKLCNISNIHWDSNVFTMFLSRNKCFTYLLLIPSIRDDTLFGNVDSIHTNTQLLYQSFISWFNSVQNLQSDLRFKRITSNN